MTRMLARYCLQCGSPLENSEYAGRVRPVCPNCGWVYFPDPKVAVVTVIEKDAKLLFVRRRINPFRGLWTLPAGFLDAGEDPVRAAAREVREETALEVEITELLGLISGQEYEKGAHLLLVYRGEITGGEIEPGDDVDRAKFFPADDPPPLAFQSTPRVLEIAGY